MNKLILLICLALSFTGKGNCQSKSDPYLPYKITITCDRCQDQKVELTKINMVSGRTVIVNEGNMDQSNPLELVGLTNESTLTFLQIGENMVSNLYIVPGTDLKVISTGTKMSFEGKDAKVNQLLYKSFEAQMSLVNEKNKVLLDFSPKEIKERLANWKIQIDKINKEVNNDVTIDAKFKKIFIANNRFLNQDFTEEYSDNGIEKPRSSLINYGHKLLSGLPIEPLYIAAAMDSYQTLIKRDFRNNWIPALYKQQEAAGKSLMGDSMALHADRLIMNDPRLNSVAEYLRAFNVIYWLRSLDSSADYEGLVNNFKNSHADSKYTSEIELVLRKHRNLATGENARNFTAKKQDGNQISLDQLKGKVVYIDVWATWCGPCIQQLPFSEKLQQSFKQDTSLVFLYVSIDSDTNNWKKFLAKRPNLGGIHVIQTDDKAKDFIWKLYELRGVPHYILIDKEGKISKNFAPRPSSDEIRKEIETLLVQ